MRHHPELERWLAECAGGVRVAELLCDRHPPDAVAVTVANAELEERRYTYGELRELSERFAALLASLGVGPGDHVAVLLPKRIEHIVAFLAIVRLGAVHVPLFTAFAAPAVAHRVGDCAATVVVTDTANRDKVSVEGAVLVSVDEDTGHEPTGAPPASYGADDPFILLYTSGTTGHPGGVEVPVRALAAFRAYLHFGLDLRPEDVYWNAADPGWAYGLYFGVAAPLYVGHPVLFLNAPFDPELAWRVLERYAVTNFAAAPTVYRALRACPRPRAGGLRLRALSSAGEPLNPDVIEWGRETLGSPILDQYGQTELGMVINNHHHPDLAETLVPGSMGRPMPGYSAVVLDDKDDVQAPPGEPGRLAIDVSDSPLFWFRGYHNAPERTAERFVGAGRYYVTGDAAGRELDGRFTFTGRADDVILTAGYRIGPFEVENVLVQHPDVAEAAVVGKPDALRGEAIHAYVVLHPGSSPSDTLAGDLQDLVRNRLARHAYPREVHIVEQLPKTPSGKVQRYLLRKLEAE